LSDAASVLELEVLPILLQYKMHSDQGKPSLEIAIP
jgi:hypothetical protein